MRPNLYDDDRGAETIEFALVFPVVVFLILGLLYALFAVAANVSLSHAATRGARYAAIPIDPVYGVYRTPDEVAAYVRDQAPLFAKSNCTTTVTGDSSPNSAVVLNISCDFPNPAGKMLNALRNFMSGKDDPDTYSDDLVMSARAESRRE
jgi:Flp pilus assembly protein TadG